MREAVKGLARAIATLAVVPALLSYWIKRQFLGRDRAIKGSSQALALVPGLPGEYVRRAFLTRTLAQCHVSVAIECGTIFSQAGARLDENVYLGPSCHLGLVHLERDVLLAAGVHIPSGAATHGTSRLDQPIRTQPGARTMVTIGEGTWIGSAAVVLADVGKHCVIAAGAVVTKPIPDFAVAAGVPARVVRERREASTS